MGIDVLEGIWAGSRRNSFNKLALLNNSRSKPLNCPERALNFSNQNGLSKVTSKRITSLLISK
jgi:hypothetical protein